MGIRKILHAALIPARPHRTNRRSRALDAAEYSPRAMVGEVPVGPRPEMAAFSWGLLLDGEPAKGGTLIPAVTALSSALGLRANADTVAIAEGAVAQLGITRDALEQAAELLDAESADRARRSLCKLLGRGRRFIRYRAKQGTEAPRSTNPLTLCGTPLDQLATGLREFPGRLTPAQLLAAWLIPLGHLHELAESGIVDKALQVQLAAHRQGKEMTIAARP
jgi:hypothetical protein